MHTLPGSLVSHSRERYCPLVKQRSEAESWGVATAPPASVLCSRAASFLMGCPLRLSLCVCFQGPHCLGQRGRLWTPGGGPRLRCPRHGRSCVLCSVHAGISELPPLLTVTACSLLIHPTGFSGHWHWQQDTSNEEVESELPLPGDLFH